MSDQSGLPGDTTRCTAPTVPVTRRGWVYADGVHPAGWYPDPSGRELIRYWDGRGWTSHVAVRNAPPRPPYPQAPMAMAVGAVLTIVVSLVASRFLLDALIVFEWPIAVYAAVAGLVGYGPVLLFCWWASHRWGRRSLRADTGFFVRVGDLGWGPLTWLACVAAQMIVALAVTALGIPFVGNLEGLDEGGLERSYVIALLLLAVVAAPIVEEMVFRGVVMRGLASRLPITAVVAVQAVVFGLAHVDPVRGVGNVGLVLILSAVGAVLGVASYLLRRIGPTIVAHAILNAVAMTIALSGWAPE